MSTPDVRPCPACGTSTIIVLTEGGYRIRVEPGRVPGGTVMPTTTGGKVRARILTGTELPAPGGAYVDHRKTCGKAKGPKAPTCLADGYPLDPWLVERGERYHVGCKPMTGREILAAAETSTAGAHPGRPAPAVEPEPETLGGAW